MRTKFLILISLLLALLGHLFFFNFSTITFTIDPETPKPKFFFLGPILKQSDVHYKPAKQQAKQNTTITDAPGLIQSGFKDMRNAKINSEKNPFTIKTIRKPLVPQTSKTENKPFIKSTFEETSIEKEPVEKPETDASNEKLHIQPYQPLRFQLP